MPRYTKTAILLHWLMALMIIATFALGVTMINIAGLTPAKLKYFSWHKWAGVTIFALACLRLTWRLLHAPPPYLANITPFEQKFAHHLHLLLYVLFFAVPISGYFYSLSSGVPVVYLGLLPLPVVIGPHPEWKPLLKETHFWLNMLLAGTVTLHVAAALKHHFIDHNRLLQRMLP